jgi:Cu(I)/Ag(I) efflux system membrane fusion protein
MHPWIKSDKPGRCTICGMALSPVYDGDRGFDLGESMTVLSSNVLQVIQVPSEPVTRRPLRRTLKVAGTIDDDDTRHRVMSAYAAGRIDRLFVNFVGAEVTEGQPLATLYSQDLLNAERDYVSLLRAPGLEGFADLSAQRERMTAAARLRLTQYGLSPEQIAALATKSGTNIHSELLSPMTGTVVSRAVYEGQYVKEGDLLFEIADFSVMWFQFDAYERDLPWIRIGQEVEVVLPAAPGRVFAGKVAFIDPNLKDMTRSAKVRVEMPNPMMEGAEGGPRRALMHRLYAEGRVRVEFPEVLAAARSAVLNPGGRPVVYVDHGDGVFEQRDVRLGRVGDTDVEILDGLADGERVVVSGNLLIDSQAQLNTDSGAPTGGAHHHGDHGTGMGREPKSAAPVAAGETGAEGTERPPLTAAQRKAARELLDWVASLADALASDDLPAFNRLASEAHPKMAGMNDAFGTEGPWRDRTEAVAASGHVASAVDLKSARRNFHELSQAAVALSRELRAREEDFGAVRVFRSPMTKDAFAGAPRTASWIQWDGPIRNPYFGAEMLDCGSEVKD